jgi:hypothetical protein
MGHEYETIRSDRAYELRRRDGDYRTWWIVDKRTNHRWCFTDVVVNGYRDNVFLRKHVSGYLTNWTTSVSMASLVR